MSELPPINLTFKPTLEILLIEDNLSDIRLIQTYFQDADMVAHNLHIVKDGISALKFIRNENGYANVPRPDIILLDIYMPDMDGDKVIKEIKNDPLLRNIPVCIMTSSPGEETRLGMENYIAAFAVKKPIDAEKFLQLIKQADPFLIKRGSSEG